MGSHGKLALSTMTSKTSPEQGDQVEKNPLLNDEGESMTAAQLEARTSQKRKYQITNILKLAAFIDLAGLVLMMPAYPSLVLNAPNGPQNMSNPSAFPAEDFVGINYSLAVMLFGMCSQLGSAIGNPISGRLIDKIGSKPVIVGCLAGGTVSYALMFVAGYWIKSFYVFLVANFINGLFGGSRSAITTFLMNLWGPRDFMPKIQPGLMSIFIYGGAGGGILGLVVLLVIPPDTPGHLYFPAAVATVFSFTCTLLVAIKCPEPARPTAPPKQDKLTFNKQHTKVFVNDKGQVSFNSCSNWNKAEWQNEKAPAEGEYSISNEVKGVKGELIELEGGVAFVNPPVLEEGDIDVPKKLKCVLWTIIIAGAMDNFGDSGTMFMRSALFTKRYTGSVSIIAQAVFIVLTIFLIKISMELIVRNSLMKQRLQLKQWTLIGNLSTGIFQLILIPVLMIPQTAGIFWGVTTLIWSFCKCFGFTSTLGAMFLFPNICPPESKGTWMGRNQGVQSAVGVVTPIILASMENGLLPITSEDGVGPGAIAVLVMCGIVSLLAAVVYFVGLIQNLPRPIMIPPPSDENVEKYRQMKPQDFMMLPFHERNNVNKSLMSQDKDLIHVPWGKYQDDLPYLGAMYDRAPSELTSLKEHILGIITNKKKMQEEQAKMGKYKAVFEKLETGKERSDFGTWIADYLDDAGYASWMMFPDMYKVMVMTAFPPLEELDNLNGFQHEPFTMQKYEARMLNWLEVLDMHLQSHAKAQKLNNNFEAIPSNLAR